MSKQVNCKHWGHAEGEWRYFCCACSGLPNGCPNCQEPEVSSMDLVSIRDALVSQSEPWWRIPTDTIIAALGRAIEAEAKVARVEALGRVCRHEESKAAQRDAGAMLPTRVIREVLAIDDNAGEHRGAREEGL